MGINFVADTDQLDEFGSNLEFINVRATIDEAMEDLLREEFIPFLTNKIKQKGLVSTGLNESEGPHLSSPRAWEIVRERNMGYKVRTIPQVSERAIHLEFGTADLIFAEDVTDSGVFRFRSNRSGNIIYPKVIRGVEEYAFFREATREFGGTQRILQQVPEELREHIERNVQF